MRSAGITMYISSVPTASLTTASSSGVLNVHEAAYTAPSGGSLSSAGAGISGTYEGNSLTLEICIAFLSAIALYNVLELLVLIFVTFKRYRGLYFWSLLIAGIGIIPYQLGFLVKFYPILDPNQDVRYLACALLTVGWWFMVTGQSVVLWSRLHMVLNNRKILNRVLYMIIFNAICLHIPTTVLTFGSDSNTLSTSELSHFVSGFNVMEKIQMCGFFTQEMIIYFLYIKETLSMLKLSEAARKANLISGMPNRKKENNSRQIMYQLVVIHIIVMGLDCALLGIEFANWYMIEATMKGTIYSIKLKMEFAVLGKLVLLVTPDRNPNHQNIIMTAMGPKGQRHSDEPRNSDDDDYPDFVDATRVVGDFTHAIPPEERSAMSSDSAYLYSAGMGFGKPGGPQQTSASSMLVKPSSVLGGGEKARFSHIERSGTEKSDRSVKSTRERWHTRVSALRSGEDGGKGKEVSG